MCRAHNQLLSMKAIEDQQVLGDISKQGWTFIGSVSAKETTFTGGESCHESAKTGTSARQCADGWGW